jgi:hypothetical protein
MEENSDQILADLAKRQRYSRGPKRIDGILSELMTRRGYARVFSNNKLLEAWSEAVPASLAGQTYPGKLSRGLLEVAVENSAVLQELAFSKQQIIAELNGLLDGQRIRDIRFRVSPLDR